jgi:16S rRNA (cytosine1402-N4)-methyltransferase
MIQVLTYDYDSPNVSTKRGAAGVKAENPRFHDPVLLEKTVELLAPAPGKVFVDGTLGGGGHSQAFLDAAAKVIGLDQDRQALDYAMERFRDYGGQFQAVHANFCDLDVVLDRLGIECIDGGFLDVGVSSWQLESAERGFSFMKNGPLDMRMNQGSPVTAAEIVNHASGEQLERIFRNFGDEPAARRIAIAIVRSRAIRPLETTFDLANAVESVVPRRSGMHPATRVFQALRIAVNRELESLADGLECFSRRLCSGGRLGVITFHSLEDRIVKNFFKTRSAEWIDRPEWPAAKRNPDRIFRLVTPKALVAGEEELERNPRARSAKLRVVEKI